MFHGEDDNIARTLPLVIWIGDLMGGLIFLVWKSDLEGISKGVECFLDDRR